MAGFESIVEEAAIAWLTELGWHHVPGPVLAPDGESPERDSYRTVVLEGRLRRALARVNPRLPPEALEEAARASERGEDRQRPAELGCLHLGRAHTGASSAATSAALRLRHLLFSAPRGSAILFVRLSRR